VPRRRDARRRRGPNTSQVPSTASPRSSERKPGPQLADRDLDAAPPPGGSSAPTIAEGTPCSPRTSPMRRAGPSASTVTTTRRPSRSSPLRRSDSVTMSPRNESHGCPVRRLPPAAPNGREPPDPLRAAVEHLVGGGERQDVRLAVVGSSRPATGDGRRTAAVCHAVSARISASSRSFVARSSRSIGSSSASPRSAGRKSDSSAGRSRSSSASASAPSKLWPSASLSSDSVSSGQSVIRSRARARSASSRTSSRAGSTTTRSTGSVERWSATEKVRRDSTSSPQNSTRTAWSPAVGKTSTIPPRTANSPRASTCGVRL
jgi:hypothetical protein